MERLTGVFTVVYLFFKGCKVWKDLPMCLLLFTCFERLQAMERLTGVFTVVYSFFKGCKVWKDIWLLSRQHPSGPPIRLSPDQGGL
jgi:hypothetical protein